MIKKITEKEVAICCGGACPHVSLDADGMINISDDFKSAIKITKDEARLLDEAVKTLLDQND